MAEYTPFSIYHEGGEHRYRYFKFWTFYFMPEFDYVTVWDESMAYLIENKTLIEKGTKYLVKGFIIFKKAKSISFVHKTIQRDDPHWNRVDNGQFDVNTLKMSGTYEEFGVLKGKAKQFTNAQLKSRLDEKKCTTSELAGNPTLVLSSSSSASSVSDNDTEIKRDIGTTDIRSQALDVSAPIFHEDEDTH